MKSLFIDLIGVGGFALLSAGLYLQYGLAITLQASGIMLLAYGLVAANKIRRSNAA
ncbi:membrane protein [Pragia fontium]|nr:membrane protein [Pragia fontium]